MNNPTLLHTRVSQAKNWTVSQIRLWIVRAGIYTNPSFLIIGAQRCGTSALFKYLCKHPDVFPGQSKEIHFFSPDFFYNKGLDWYHSQFPLPSKLGEYGVTFDGTPAYIYYPEVPQRIYKYNPNLKMILILRDPVERAHSAWNMFRRTHKYSSFLQRWYTHTDQLLEQARSLLMQEEYPSFEKAIRNETDKNLSEDTHPWPGFVRRGIYVDQIERYFKYFDRKQIMIIDNSQLRNETNRVLEDIVAFIKLRPYDWNPSLKEKSWTSEYKAPIDGETKTFLTKFYKPHNERLYKLLDRDFDW